MYGKSINKKNQQDRAFSFIKSSFLIHPGLFGGMVS
ncbi:Uncharacterised protein [Escherichia coli]|uniref:Uncharacterized protein n=1 Tax=Escherichia coli TaxID=562 RepID=A0A376KLW2_ECOLX|nr:Uncharacterised protein [Escherichia coli]